MVYSDLIESDQILDSGYDRPYPSVLVLDLLKALSETVLIIDQLANHLATS